MSHRGIALAALLLATSTTHAAWTPIFRPGYVQLRPGETVTIQASGAWTSGVSLYPFTPFTFTSQDPGIATVEGHVPTGTASYDVRITGHTVGITHVRVVDPPAPADRPWAFIVVAEAELPVHIGIDGILAKDQAITLTAITGDPDATFTWYRGEQARFEPPAGTGREHTFVPEFPAHFEYWVLATSPRGAGMASVVVKVRETPAPPRRRAIRH